MKRKLLIGAIGWLMIGLVSAPVLAQEPLPTKPPVEAQPTKPPVEPLPTKPPLEPTSAPSVPTSAPPEPTSAPPTKEPPAPLPTKPQLATPMSWPTPVEATSTSRPTATPLPTARVTILTATSRAQTSEPGPAVSATPILNGAAAPTRTVTARLDAPQLIGVAFEDVNSNGVQDVGEPGLPDVAVIIEGPGLAQTLITDAGGAYRVAANPQATARVIPPAGWVATQPAALPLDRACNFPLRPRIAEPASSLPAVTASVINLTSLALGFLGLGAIVWLAVLQHQRVRVNSFNAWARADLRLRSEAERLERRNQLTIDEAWIVALLNQAALDATGEAPGIDQLDRIVLEPLPALVGLGRDFQRLVFTPAPATVVRHLVKQKALVDLLGESLRGVRLFPIDALNGDLFVVDDLTAALTARAHGAVTLPRAERWSLYVVPQQRGKVAR